MIKLLIMRIKLYKLCKKNKYDFGKNQEVREMKRRIYEAERIYLYDQRVFVYCPSCGCELLSSDNCSISEPNLVYFECHNCDTGSMWDFDAPAPILIKHNNI